MRYPDGLAHPEWSAREGILSERFMVGPEVRGQTYARPLALSPELDRRRPRPPPLAGQYFGYLFIYYLINVVLGFCSENIDFGRFFRN